MLECIDNFVLLDWVTSLNFHTIGLLSYFWELSNTDEGKRLDATKHLLEFLDSSLEQEVGLHVHCS